MEDDPNSIDTRAQQRPLYPLTLQRLNVHHVDDWELLLPRTADRLSGLAQLDARKESTWNQESVFHSY